MTETPSPDADATATPGGDRRYPDRPWVGVGVVVLAGEEVLLVRRGRPPRKGDWGLPGGAQETGETVFATARREVMEECGLEVEPTGIVTVVDAISRDDAAAVQYHYTIVEVAARIEPGPDGALPEPVPGDDVDGAQWVNLDQIDTWLKWGETRRVILEAAGRKPADQPQAPRLKRRPRLASVMSSPLGQLIARPWYDAVSIRALRHWFFPASRAWAAAIAADGDRDRFAAEVGIEPGAIRMPALVEQALRRIAADARHHRQVVANWDAAFFGPDDPGPADLVAAEEARLESAQRLALGRVTMAVFARAHGTPAVRFELPTQAAVEASHGHRLHDPASAFTLPDAMPEVTVSRPVNGAVGREYWIRFANPIGAVAEPAIGHVFEPAGIANPPTVVDLHGICMEPDHMRLPWREVDILTGLGLRVIALEGPWHGFRRHIGWYGGEPFVARAPLGALDYFRAHLPELACATQWARSTSNGPVGWYGTSLGALSAQLAACQARSWPHPCRAEAMMLATTGEGIAEIAFEGALAEALGLDEALASAGWDRTMLDRWGPLANPLGEPVMRPDRIFLIAGTRDTVVGPTAGRAIAARWGVPDANVFVREQGHFSVPIGLMVDQAPLVAFADALKACGT